MPSGSFDTLSSDDYASLRPEILGQLFDKILDCLQNDFDELVGKLKEQVNSDTQLTAHTDGMPHSVLTFPVLIRIVTVVLICVASSCRLQDVHWSRVLIALVSVPTRSM